MVTGESLEKENESENEEESEEESGFEEVDDVDSSEGENVSGPEHESVVEVPVDWSEGKNVSGPESVSESGVKVIVPDLESTVVVADLTDGRGDSKHSYNTHQKAKMEPVTEEDPAEAWMYVSENAFGGLISESMINGLMAGLIKFLPQVVISVAVQSVFSMYIWGIAREFCTSNDQGTWDCLSNNSTQCENVGGTISMVAIGVYFLMLVANLRGIYKHARILWICDRIEVYDVGEALYDGDATVAELSSGEKCVVFLLGVVTEMFTWALMVMMGIMFVFQAVSNEEVNTTL
jgi:hypothetical protein